MFELFLQNRYKNVNKTKIHNNYCQIISRHVLLLASLYLVAQTACTRLVKSGVVHTTFEYV